jgi:hypothetical protein
MSRIKIAALCVVVLIVGIAIGGYGAVSYMSTFNSALLSSRLANAATADVNTRVMVLRSLRASNQTAAIEMLEALLDGDLLVLGSFKPEERPASASRILRSAAEYRSKYPHKADSPEVNAGVQRAFQSVGAGT